MRLFVALCLSCLLASSGLGQEKLKVEVSQSGPKPKDIPAYQMGYGFGFQLHQGGLEAGDIAAEDIIAGMTDALKEIEPRVSEAEVKSAVEALGRRSKLAWNKRPRTTWPRRLSSSKRTRSNKA